MFKMTFFLDNIKHACTTLLCKYALKWSISCKYKKKLGKNIDWDHPRDLNEKICWLAACTDTSEWTRLANKYTVREYVAAKGFEENLVDLYGRWEKAENIDWDRLPDRFVMKANNGYDGHLICYDKSLLDIASETKRFKKLLRKRFGYDTFEPHYTRIKPCIIAEELLDPGKQAVVSSSLVDYKIWCFNGKAEHIWVYSNRTEDSVEFGIYDPDWNYHPEWAVATSCFLKQCIPLPKPETLPQMIEMAEQLSEGFPEVRVDMYEVDGRVRFGEMTFTSGGGCMNHFDAGYLVHLGEKVDLNLVKRNQQHEIFWNSMEKY